MEKMMITDLPKEIMYMIFTKITTKTMISCRRVCKNWHQVINDEKRLMNRFYMQIFPETYHQILESQPAIVPKFINLKLNRLQFAEPLSEYLLTLLPTVENIVLLKCRVHQQHLMALFETLFGAINNFEALNIRSVDQIELDGFTVLPTTYEGSGVKRIKLQYFGFISPPLVKNLNIKITDIEDIIRFFEQLKDMNVIVQRLNIHLLDDCHKNRILRCRNLHQLLNLFHKYYQHLIKELTIDSSKVPMVLDRFYGRLAAMGELRLDTLRLKKNDALWLQGVFKVFIKNQVALRTLEVEKEFNHETVNVVRAVLPNLKSLKMGVDTQANHTYFWRNFAVNLNMKILKFNVGNSSSNLPLNVEIDFGKVPALDILEIKKADCASNSFFLFMLILEPALSFVNINQNNLKKLTIFNVAMEDRKFKQIFDYMQNLEHLELNGRIVKNVSMTSTSINKLKRLHTLWLDESVAIGQQSLLETLQLPSLKKLGLFKSESDIVLSNCCLNIHSGILEQLANNCPRLFQICDDSWGTTFQRSKLNDKFIKTQDIRKYVDADFFGLRREQMFLPF